MNRLVVALQSFDPLLGLLGPLNQFLNRTFQVIVRAKEPLATNPQAITRCLNLFAVLALALQFAAQLVYRVVAVLYLCDGLLDGHSLLLAASMASRKSAM